MVKSENILIGLLMISLVATGVILTYSNAGLRLEIKNDRSVFYSFINDSWEVSGTEYNKLYNGSSLVKGKIIGSVNTSFNGSVVTIVRNTKFGNTLVRDTYVFDGNVSDIELFPVSHIVEVINGTGLTYQYEVRDLVYAGKTINVVGLQSMSFGNNMKVDWQDGQYYATVSSNGVLRVKYKVNSDYESYGVRLFDPIIPVGNVYILPVIATDDTVLNGYCNLSNFEGVNVDYEYRWWNGSNLAYFGATNNVSICYQETANVSTVCGGLSSGSYNYTGSGPAIGYIYMNYTKPVNATINSFWQVKHGAYATYNISFNSTEGNIECFEQSSLQLRIQSQFSTSQGTQPQCYNGTSWVSIGKTQGETGGSSGSLTNNQANAWDTNYGTYTCRRVFLGWGTCTISDNHIYEEAMYWGYGHVPGIPYLISSLPASNSSIGETWKFSCRSTNGTNFTEWVNSTGVTILENPAVNNVSISPSFIRSGDNLTGQCNASISTGDNLTLYYDWFVNNVSVLFGNTSYINVSNLLVNISNLSYTNTSVGDTVIFSCLASTNVLNSTWQNSTSIPVNSSFNVTHCVGASFVWIFNVSYFNFSTGKLLQYGVASNSTTCLYNATSEVLVTDNVTARVSPLKNGYNMSCSLTDDNSTGILLNNYTNTSLGQVSGGVSVGVYCWIDYINATSGWKFNLTVI